MNLKESIELLIKRRQQQKDNLPAFTFNGIAKEIGVSPPTLRKAINEDPKISQAYRDYISNKVKDKLMFE